MSVVTKQPLPIGRLEREKHIQMIFRVFQNRCGPSPECHCHSAEHKPHNTPAALESEEHLSEMNMKNIHMQPPGKLTRPWVEEHRPGSAAGSDFTSMLESVCKIQITARPELQGMKNCVFVCYSVNSAEICLFERDKCFLLAGPQCVPRRIYSISTGGRRSQLFMAVEGTSACSANLHLIYISYK